MHRSSMLPFNSSARAFSTPAKTVYRLSASVLCSSSFGHAQVGHSVVELSAVTAISKPSMLMMCRKAIPR